MAPPGPGGITGDSNLEQPVQANEASALQLKLLRPFLTSTLDEIQNSFAQKIGSALNYVSSLQLFSNGNPIETGQDGRSASTMLDSKAGGVLTADSFGKIESPFNYDSIALNKTRVPNGQDFLPSSGQGIPLEQTLPGSRNEEDTNGFELKVKEDAGFENDFTDKPLADPLISNSSFLFPLPNITLIEQSEALVNELPVEDITKGDIFTIEKPPAAQQTTSSNHIFQQLDSVRSADLLAVNQDALTIEKTTPPQQVASVNPSQQVDASRKFTEALPSTQLADARTESSPSTPAANPDVIAFEKSAPPQQVALVNPSQQIDASRKFTEALPSTQLTDTRTGSNPSTLAANLNAIAFEKPASTQQVASVNSSRQMDASRKFTEVLPSTQLTDTRTGSNPSTLAANPNAIAFEKPAPTQQVASVNSSQQIDASRKFTEALPSTQLADARTGSSPSTLATNPDAIAFEKPAPPQQVALVNPSQQIDASRKFTEALPSTQLADANNEASSNLSTFVEKIKPTDQQATVANNTDSTSIQTKIGSAITNSADKGGLSDQTVASTREGLSTGATQQNRSLLADTGADTVSKSAELSDKVLSPGELLAKTNTQSADIITAVQGATVSNQLTGATVERSLQSLFVLAKTSTPEQSIPIIGQPSSITANPAGIKATDAIIGNEIQAAKNLQGTFNEQRIQTLVREIDGIRAALQIAQGAASNNTTIDSKVLVPRSGIASTPENITAYSGVKGVPTLSESTNGSSLPGIRSIIPGKDGSISDTTEPSKLPVGTTLPPGVQASGSNAQTNKDPQGQNTGNKNTDPNAADPDSIESEVEGKRATGGSSVPGIASKPGQNNQADLKTMLVILALFASVIAVTVKGLPKPDVTQIAIRKRRASERKVHMVQPGEKLGDIAQGNYGDPTLAKTIYYYNIQDQSGNAAVLDRIENENDVEAIKNIQPEPGTLLVILSHSEVACLEITQANAFKTRSKEEKYGSLKKVPQKEQPGFDHLLPKWAREISSLSGIFNMLGAQFISLATDTSIENAFKNLLSQFVKTGYIAKRRRIVRIMSLTGRQFRVVRPQKQALAI